MADPNTISSLQSTVINSAISQMSDTELCNVLLSINNTTETDTLIKCDQESLDKIFRVKRENIETIIEKEENMDEDISRVMECVTNFAAKDNPSFDDYKKVVKEMSWVIDELKKDNKRCENDILSLELALEKCQENFFMYEEDLCEDSVKICKEKMETTEGLIRLRYKTLETNTQSIKGLERVVQSLTECSVSSVE